MGHERERIKIGCQKILDEIGSISLVNLDDQQVHSLVMMREIARGVVDDNDRKVTKGDVIDVLRFSIEKMVAASSEIIEILSKMTCRGLDDQRLQLIFRMKEIAHGITDKQAPVSITRSEKLSEQNGNYDEAIRESLISQFTPTSNGDFLIEEEQMMMLDNEMLDIQQLQDEDEQNEDPESLLLSPFPKSMLWPLNNCINLDWVQDMMQTLEQFSQNSLPSDFYQIMPTYLVEKLMDAACCVLQREPNCVEINCVDSSSRVVVVGDIHGQFHDLISIFKNAGFPAENQFYVFNGNYVDRGAWGMEILLVLLAWKVLMPHRVHLLRGNHESKFCTSRYGFKKEVLTKYGKQGEDVYNKCLECFKELPLASIIAGCIYTTHGGLFRSMREAPSRKSKRKKTKRFELGSLAELCEVNRSYIDPPNEGPNILLSDVLWSKPSKKYGLRSSLGQRVGLWWGPDCTEAFLKQSKLKLIIRSHEGPDARAGRDFNHLLSGYSIDHIGESGKLYTLFSAPDYPQFGKKRYNNEGAYAILHPHDFENPSFHSFKAVGRPKVEPYFVRNEENAMHSGKSNLTGMQSETPTISPSIRSYPAGVSGFDFGALGVYNAPTWNVHLPDDSGGTQVLQVPRAPAVEGLPLSPNIQEPHKAAYEYLFELIAGLKHLITTREAENKARQLALQRRVKKHKRLQNS